MTFTELGRAACDYVTRHGWPVLPCVARGKVPLTEHGLKDASADIDVVTDWWTRWPDANIGVRTDDFVVVDCDGVVGKRTFGLLVDGVGFTDSPYAWSGGGGMHIWYRRDNHPIRNRAGWLDHVDIRSQGGYCIVPPSIHPSGRDYYWEHGPDERDVPPLPALLVDALVPRSSRTTSQPPPTCVRDGYARAALERELDTVRGAPEGVRNQTLVAAAFNLGQLVAGGALDTNQVAAELFGAATLAGLPGNEASRTIASGIQAGIRTPRSR